jgi:hypothetical protein
MTDAKLEEPDMPIVGAGQRLPKDFLEEGILRRAIHVPFAHKPKPGDYEGNFETDMEAATAPMLVTSARIYRDLAHQYGSLGEDVQNHKDFPAVLRTGRTQAEENLCGEEQFFGDIADDLGGHEDAYLPHKAILNMHKDWLKDHEDAPKTLDANRVIALIKGKFPGVRVVHSKPTNKKRDFWPPLYVSEHNATKVRSSIWYYGIDVAQHITAILAKED